ncbi:hypothetical protein DVH05_022048 [Phytophthora capsici]|nr:hypothetical protein DVH05_022048 [Phytophthora capsici]
MADGAKREEANKPSSIGVKRSHKASNKANKAPKQPKSAPKKQPDVIDLVSDDEEDEDEDVGVQQVIKQSLETFRDQERQTGLFQSREFPTVTFDASDFPTMEESTQMRKNAVGMSHSQPIKGPSTGINGVVKPPTLASQPVAGTKEDAGEKQEHRATSAETVEKKVVVTPEKKKEEKATAKEADKKTQKEKEVASSSSLPGEEEEKQNEKAVAEVEMEEKMDPFFQSRMFDTIEFKLSDFPQVESLAVARRSLPPASSSNTAPLTTTGQSTNAPPASKPNDGLGPAKTPTVASMTTPVVTTATATEAKTPKVAASVVSKVPKTTTPATSATMGTTQSVLKETTESAKQPSTDSVPKPLVVTKTSTTPPNPTVVTPSTKAPATQSTSTAVPFSTQAPTQATSTTKAGPTQSQLPHRARVRPRIPPVSVVPVPSKPVTATPSTTKSSTAVTAITPPPVSKSTAAVPVASTVDATKSSSAPATGQNQANENANMLLPKKRLSEEVQRAGDAKRQAKPHLTTVKAPVDGEGVEFVKVNAAPRAIPPVEPPVLGYCTPEFLAFMRECGDEDGDEEVDPEEESRSQLKLLDVVDLTNLSDSEDSETESLMPTPRGVPLQSLPVTGQATAATTPTGIAPVNVSGTRTWFVPTLGSERKRTQPEKVLCELCEEKGLPHRLIHCPTCTKYYHKKCAKENGDENICWNCELGSMIDDSELDEEHARHNSEYLAYLKGIRRSSSPERDENKGEVGDENEEQEGEEVEDGDVEMPSADAADEDNSSFSEDTSAKKAGRSWMEFVGDVTGDVDAGFHEVTNRITEELRDEEKRQLYSRGFVSREEFEEQMTEVEEYYISEEARLQQLEREKAIEAKKAAEARKAQAEAEEKASSDQPQSSTTTADAPSIPPSVAQDGGATADTSANPSTPVPALPSAVPRPAPVVFAPSADFREAPDMIKAVLARSFQPPRSNS